MPNLDLLHSIADKIPSPISIELTSRNLLARKNGRGLTRREKRIVADLGDQSPFADTRKERRNDFKTKLIAGPVVLPVLTGGFLSVQAAPIPKFTDTVESWRHIAKVMKDPDAYTAGVKDVDAAKKALIEEYKSIPDPPHQHLRTYNFFKKNLSRVHNVDLTKGIPNDLFKNRGRTALRIFGKAAIPSAALALGARYVNALKLENEMQKMKEDPSYIPRIQGPASNFIRAKLRESGYIDKHYAKK